MNGVFIYSIVVASLSAFSIFLLSGSRLAISMLHLPVGICGMVYAAKHHPDPGDLPYLFLSLATLAVMALVRWGNERLASWWLAAWRYPGELRRRIRPGRGV